MRQETYESFPFTEGQMLILEGPKLLENGPESIKSDAKKVWVVKS